MALRLLLGRFVQPLGLSFHTMLAVAIPTAIIGPIIRPVSMLISRLFLRVSISPAFCPVNTFALREWGTLVGLLETWFCPVAAETVPARSIGILTILLSDCLIGIAAATVAVFAIVPVSKSSIVTTCGAVRDTHAAVEALSAFGAKTLARFHRTPAFTILVGVSPPAEGVIRPVVFEPIIAIICIAGLVAEVESLRSVSGLGFFDTLFDLTELVVSHGGRRGEASPWGSKNDIIRVYGWISLKKSNWTISCGSQVLTRIAP